MCRTSWVVVSFGLLGFIAGPDCLVRGEEGREKPAAQRVELVVQLGHSVEVTSVALSPNGAHILTGSDDETACLWDVATGRQVRRLVGHGGPVTSVAFSPDGTQVLTGLEDKTVRLWDLATGKEIRRFEGHEHAITSVVFSPDGTQVLTGSEDGTARLWEAATGREFRRFEHPSRYPITSVALSPDGRGVLTGSEDETARLWHAGSGMEVRRFEGHEFVISSVAFSPDGTQILTGSWDETARLWDATTGKEIRCFKGHGENVVSVAIAAKGTLVLTGSWDGTARLWEGATGREIGHVRPHGGVSSVALSPDGTRALTGGSRGLAQLWDVTTGREIRRFGGGAGLVWSAAFSPDGTHLVTASEGGTSLWDGSTGKEIRRFGGRGASSLSVAYSPDGTHVLAGMRARRACLWQVATGREIRRFELESGTVPSAAFSPDGTHVLTGSFYQGARLWEAATGKEIRNFRYVDSQYEERVFWNSPNRVAFSPDGRHVLTSEWRDAWLWEASTGREIRRFEGHGGHVESVAFTPDGRQVITGSEDGTARVWLTATAEEVGRLEGHGGRVHSVSPSADGTQVLTGLQDGTARLWETETGREVCRYEGHSGPVSSATSSPDGRRVLTTSWDQTARLWERETGTELCTLVSLRDGAWAVVDRQGRFDASNSGDVEGLHWVVGLEPISLEQLKSRYYDPGLLAKHMGLSGEALRAVDSFDQVKLHPEVEVEPPRPDSQHVLIHLTNRGGGIGRVVVLVNGKEVAADARVGQVTPDAEQANLSVDLTDDPRVKPGEENTVQVYAYNAEGYLRSRGPVRKWTAPGKKPSEPPHLWAVVCGVSNYRGMQIDLRFADKDAEDFATALRLAANGLFGEERVHLSLLSTSRAEGALRPTRENLRRVFEAARKAGPNDLMVVYLSGHGVSVSGQSGDYHYLLAEADSADLTDPAVRQQYSVSSAELTRWINEIPASERLVLILDTCASGQLIADLTEARDVPSSQVRALDRLKDRTGMFVLAGCASNKVSYEATRYAQGLLTYSLLRGMKGGALRDGEFVDVQKLLSFAEEEVPRLAKDVGGVQQPQVARPKQGASFDIGQLSPEAVAKIPLPNVKPVLQRSQFADGRQMRDRIGLGRAVDDVLRTVAARGREAPVVHVDATGMPDAYQIVGRYTVTKGEVTVNVALWKGDDEVTSFPITGSEADVMAIAKSIVNRAQAMAEGHHRQTVVK